MSKNKNVLIVDREKYPRVPLDVLDVINENDLEILNLNNRNTIYNIIGASLSYNGNVVIYLLDPTSELLALLTKLEFKWYLVYEDGTIF